MNGGSIQEDDLLDDLRDAIEAADRAREDWLNAGPSGIERAQKQYTALALDVTNMAIRAWVDGAL